MTRHPQGTRVVIRFIQGAWGIVHARSYQNAFSNKVNRFNARAAAVRFAERNGCTVERHPGDPLQKRGSNP